MVSNAKNRALLFFTIFAISCINSLAAFSKEAQEPRVGSKYYSSTRLNISVFAFHDLNRNGIYDIGDRPMSGITFRMQAPDGIRRVKRSNKSGFANFAMSVTPSDNPDINSPGEHRFELRPPANWIVTTGNKIQTRRFKLLDGAPAGIVTLTPFKPVGLARKLTISGRVGADAGSGGKPASSRIELLAYGPNGNRTNVKVDRNGKYSFEARQGKWRIAASDNISHARQIREIEVKAYPIQLSTMVLATSSKQSRGSIQYNRVARLDFDTLTTAGGIIEIPSGYGGLGWRNWVATHQKFYNGEGYVNTNTSGEYVAYNSSGHPVSIYRKEGFNFVGGSFGLAWSASIGEILFVKGWKNGALVYEDELVLDVFGPTYFDANYIDVDRIDFSTKLFWQFVVDDILIGSTP